MEFFIFFANVNGSVPQSMINNIIISYSIIEIINLEFEKIHLLLSNIRNEQSMNKQLAFSNKSIKYQKNEQKKNQTLMASSNIFVQ